MRRQLFGKLGIVCLCLTTLSGCLVLSTAHLKDNIFDRILQQNVTNAASKILGNELNVQIKSLAIKNNSNMSIVEYYEKNGGHCVYGYEITCKYQNEVRVLMDRLIYTEIVGGLRFTWVFKMKNSARKSGDFEVSVVGETLVP